MMPLILASSGAHVTLCESNPVMALLLYYEYQAMAQVANWQDFWVVWILFTKIPVR